MALDIEEAFFKGVEAQKTGRLEEANSLYAGVLGAQPLHPDANHNMGILAITAGDTTAALALFKTATDVSPYIAQFWHSYILTLLNESLREAATNALEDARAHGLSGPVFVDLERKIQRLPKNSTAPFNGDPPALLVQPLLDLYAAGQLTQALKESNVMALQFPKSAVLCNILGAIYAKLEKFDTAIANIQKAVTFDPNYAEAHFNMASALLAKGDRQAAINRYKRVVQIKPDYAQAHFNMGNLFRDQNDLDAAINSYHNAIKAHSEYAEAHHNLGHLYFLAERYEDAREAQQRAIDLQPSLSKLGLSWTLQAMRLYDDAIEVLSRVVNRA